MMKHYQGVYYADTARVLGEVEIAAGVSIWPSASIRGDVAKVTIGQCSNVQDCAVIHCDSGQPNTIGANVTIGHSAIVHGRCVGDWTLIGMGAKVLGGVIIGERCLIAAGAVVPPGTVVPDDHVVMGVPGKIARETKPREKEYLKWLAPHYVALAKRHHEQPNAPDIKAWPPID